jgi:hypothetical protein
MVQLLSKTFPDPGMTWFGGEPVECLECQAVIERGGVWYHGHGGTALCEKCAVKGAAAFASVFVGAQLDTDGDVLDVDLEGALGRFADHARRLYREALLARAKAGS